MRYTVLMISISIILTVCSFFIIAAAYSDIAESVVVIHDSRNIKSNPDALKSDIEMLEQRQRIFGSRLERISKLQQADLETFNSVSRQNGVKLTGVNLKEKSGLKNNPGKGYQLIFSGRITSILSTLHYIENNLAIIIESASIYSNEFNNDLVDLKLTIIIPD